MFNIKQNYKNLKRTREILKVVTKYGLGYFLDFSRTEGGLNLKKKIFPEKVIKLEKIQRLTLPQRTRLACEELGPTFIKLGQILSVRPDLIPYEFTKEFSKLQDEVLPFSFEEVEEQFERELGKSINELFIEFDKRPVAAASLSQVHKAKLISGETVAVKIQRPNVRKVIETDISILFSLVKFAEKRFINGRLFQPVEIIREFSQSVEKELDFINEGHNIEKFRTNFRESETVHIPKVYWKSTTKKILTMEFIEGVKISKVINLKDSNFDKKIISDRGIDMILKQILVDGFFHGDPHPGNIFIMKDNIIAPIDFGMVGRIEENTMINMADFLIAAISNDADKVVRVLENMDIVDSEMDLKKIRVEIGYFMDKYYNVSLKQLEMGRIIEEIMKIMIQHQIKVPSDLVLLTKALVTIEGIGRELDPDFNMVARAKPFANELIKRKYSLGNLLKVSGKFTEELFNSMKTFPNEFSYLIRNLRKGKLTISFQHKGLEKLILEIDRASNRLSFSMIISALIIGSSFIILSDKGPFIFDYPALGIFGYLIAAVLGLWLVISIIRRGGL
ncbi:AarF/ABC1/UbiB kinase family protein [Candidatus Parcubacteria bacterium]|nr:AarF/ABC1/UbiB kinase family protein [Candidatus Parcubacteria bacterium]